MTIKVLVFDYRPTEKEFFECNNFENFDINLYPESLNEETVKNIPQEIKDEAYVISVFIDSVVSDEVIKQFKNLRIVSTRSTGFDHINHKTCVEKNISLINVENYGSKTVAQYIMGLILSLVRNIVPASQYLKTKDKQMCIDYIGRDLSALTLGVIGTGAIGASVCKLSKAFGMKILAYDIHEKQELIEKFDVEFTTFENLLKNSDIISLHVPYTGENAKIISENEFELMKQNAYLINTARGELVDTVALYNAITNGKLKGCALDVVPCESATFQCKIPEKTEENLSLECVQQVRIIKKLSELDNVIITPHIAYQTEEAVNYILEMTFKGIMDSIKGGFKYRIV